MRDFPQNDCANQDLQERNYADYCDALSAEHWSRLLDAIRRMKSARSRLWATDQEHVSGESSAAGIREELSR